jgi:nucleoside-diphosphate-sugar epimerase
MTLNNRAFLVTGGTGFIGSALVKALAERGARVRSFDNEWRGACSRLADAGPGVELVTGDIRDADAVRRAAAGVDCVCHLAYINGTKYFYSEPELVLDVAVRGMLNVLDACRVEGVKDLVLASSSEVYEDPLVIPTDELVPLSVPDVLNPRFSYGGGKIACELLAVNFGRVGFDRVAIFRPHNAYGPDMGLEHVVPQFVLRMEQCCRESDGPVRFPIQGSGNETRAYVYITDLIDGVLRVIERGEHLGIYHIGTEQEVTVEHLARKVGHCFGRAVEVIPGARLPGSTLRRCPDITKMRGLGYAPAVSLEHGLAATVAWYVNQPGRETADRTFRNRSARE